MPLSGLAHPILTTGAWRESILGTETSGSMLAHYVEALLRRALETQTHVSLFGSHTVATDNALDTSDTHTAPSIPAELDQRLHLISQLPHNWNSYGAVPIAPESIAETRRIVELGLSLGLSVPRVAPGSGASMSIEWDSPRGELIIDILPTKENSFVLALGEDEEEVEGVLGDDNIEDILRQFMSSES